MRHVMVSEPSLTRSGRPRRRGAMAVDVGEMESEHIDVDTKFVIEQMRQLHAGLIRCTNMLVTGGEVIWCAKLPEHEPPCAGIRHNGDIRQWAPTRGKEVTRIVS